MLDKHQADKIEALEKKVEKLEKEVKELQKNSGPQFDPNYNFKTSVPRPT